MKVESTEFVTLFVNLDILGQPVPMKVIESSRFGEQTLVEEYAFVNDWGEFFLPELAGIYKVTFTIGKDEQTLEDVVDVDVEYLKEIS